MTDWVAQFFNPQAQFFNVATLGAFLTVMTTLGLHLLGQNKQDRINRGNFWLEIEKMFKTYDDFYQHLRVKIGDWYGEDLKGPTNVQNRSPTIQSGANNLALMRDYLGLFEHCNLLLKQKIIDLQTFENIYKTRVMGILSNKFIRGELMDEKNKKTWSDFHDLLNRLGLTDKEDHFLFGKNSNNELVFVKRRRGKQIIRQDERYNTTPHPVVSGNLLAPTIGVTPILCKEKSGKNIYCLETGDDWKALIESNIWRRKYKSKFRKFVGFFMIIKKCS